MYTRSCIHILCLICINRFWYEPCVSMARCASDCLQDVGQVDTIRLVSGRVTWKAHPWVCIVFKSIKIRVYIYNIYIYIFIYILYTLYNIDINRIVTRATFIALFVCLWCMSYDFVWCRICWSLSKKRFNVWRFGTCRKPEANDSPSLWTVDRVPCWKLSHLLDIGFWRLTLCYGNFVKFMANLCRWLLYIVSMQRLLRWIRRNSAHMSWRRPWDGPRLERDNRSEGARVLPCSACRLQTVPSMRI